jgi:hypothetical protein
MDMPYRLGNIRRSFEVKLVDRNEVDVLVS